MNIENFMNNMMVDDFENYIIKYFDEVMALYDLIGSCNNIRVTPNQNSKDIKFDLVLESSELAQELKTIIDTIEISKYGHIYTVDSLVLGATLEVELIDRACG